MKKLTTAEMIAYGEEFASELVSVLDAKAEYGLDADEELTRWRATIFQGDLSMFYEYVEQGWIKQGIIDDVIKEFELEDPKVYNRRTEIRNEIKALQKELEELG